MRNERTEPIYLTPEDVEKNFAQKISKQLEFWISIVDASTVDDEIKEEVKEALFRFKDSAFKDWDNFDDAVYKTISSILTATTRDKKDPEARALFQNLRDDIWDFWREVKR